MQRYVLRFRGSGPAPAGDLDCVRGTTGVKVVDTSSRMVLVEAAPEAIENLRAQLPSWLIAAEGLTPLPDSRARLK